MNKKLTLIRLHIIIIIHVLFFDGCNQKNHTTIQREYYKNGMLKIVQEVKNGILDGHYISYYPNGKIEYDVNWVNGKQNGAMRHYYPSGLLESYTNVFNDTPHGIYLMYYQNGALAQKGRYYKGVQIGTSFIYDSLSKKKIEMHIHNRGGDIIYAHTYSSQGKSLRKGPLPIIEIPDTLEVGITYKGCLKFGYNISGRIVMLVGNLVKNPKSSDRYQITDTIAKVKPDAKGYFCFSYKPVSARGHDKTIGYKFLHTGNMNDSLSLNLMSGYLPFFVKNKKIL